MPNMEDSAPFFGECDIILNTLNHGIPRKCKSVMNSI